MVIHCDNDFDFEQLLRYWQQLEELESNPSAQSSFSQSNTASIPCNPASHRPSFQMATQTMTQIETMNGHIGNGHIGNGHLVQYPFKTEKPVNAVRIPSRSPSPARRSNKNSRERLFSALEHGNPILRAPREIESADDLDEVELKRCFEILHACGTATDKEASLKKTRETIEEFLDAVFKDWSTSGRQEINKPIMDFVVREAVAVGKICDYPNKHNSIDECTDSRTCNSTVYVIALYNSKPATLQMGFCLQETLDRPASEAPEFFSPMDRHDIRWMNLNFMPLLKRWVTDACVAKVHKHNKHLAIWLTRKLIRGWSVGSIEMGDNDLISNYIGTESVNATFATMGLLGTA